MPTRCSKCGAEVEDGWPACRKCFEPLKRPGFFSRLLRPLRSRVNITVSSSPTAVPGFTTRSIDFHSNQSFKVREGKTGEMREYHSLEEVPEQFRETFRKQMLEAEKAVLTGQNTSAITWTDASGTVHHCKSLDELPPEMRAICKQALGDKDQMEPGGA